MGHNENLNSYEHLSIKFEKTAADVADVVSNRDLNLAEEVHKISPSSRGTPSGTAKSSQPVRIQQALRRL